VTALAERIEAFLAHEQELARAAAIAGEAGCRILLVGGAVRDLVLGRPLADLDFILDGPPPSPARWGTGWSPSASAGSWTTGSAPGRASGTSSSAGAARFERRSSGATSP
jgi:hypothetical protein